LKKVSPLCIHTDIVIQIKLKVECLPCLGIAHPSAFMIVKTNISDKAYEEILKQQMHDKEQLVRNHSGIWLGLQQNYSIIKREILSVVLAFSNS